MVQVAANLATIAIAVLLAIGIARYRPWSTDSPTRFDRPTRPEAVTAKGKRIDLAGVDWAANGHTVVIALREGCRFCDESAPFYRRLVQLKGGKAHLVAVLPQPVAESTKYLASLGISIPDIKQSSLNSLSVTGTPTILLLDQTGMVTDVWIGKLGNEAEEEIIKRITSGV